MNSLQQKIEEFPIRIYRFFIPRGHFERRMATVEPVAIIIVALAKFIFDRITSL